MSLDFSTKSDIQRSIRRIREIINSGIFHPKNGSNPLVESAFIEVCILLNDLLAKTAKFSTRVDFTDDVSTMPNLVNDVTDLMSKVRNAVCHISSPLHLVDKENQLGASFNIMYGQVHGGVGVGDFIQSSDYPDDIAFWFGVYRVYLFRHIIRSLNEAEKNLAPLL